MRTLAALSPVLAAALAGCWWTVPENDDGDEAFVAQAVEAILGRKPHGGAEISALADLAESHGRPAVVDVLFERPEYVAYWSQVLADDLEVQRTGGMAIDANCAAPPLLSPAAQEILAAHLATEPASEEFCTWRQPDTIGFAFTEEQFWKAFDAAEAAYPFTPVTRLGEPEPLLKPVAQPVQIASKEPVVPSAFWDIEAEGGGPSNMSYFDVDGKSAVASAVDYERFDKLLDGIAFDFCPPFNLTDVLQASVRTDRLDAAYRAYLPVLATFPGTDFDSSMRDELGSTFLDVYLDRDPACMMCHTATYSTTDPRPLNANWDRFYPVWYGLPIPLDAEGTVFSHDLGGGDFVYGGDGGDAARRRTGAFFRRANHIAGGLLPWGFDETCVTNPGRGFDGFDTTMPSDFTDAAFAGLGPSKNLGVLDLTEALSDATASFDSVGFEVPDWAAYRAARGANLPPEDPPCPICHTPSTSDPSVASVESAPLLINRVPTLSDQRLFSIIRFGSGQMDAMTSSDAEAWDWVEWVRANYPQSPALEMKDRNHGFLYLMSAAIVNNVVDEVLGENVVMAHTFPRNPDQSATLSSFALTFSERYSLQDLLAKIVLSDAFNRMPPEEPGTDPYILPMIPFPEAEVSPLVTSPPLGANANSEGDFVHKVSPAGLLHQVHEALGWPAPPIVGDPVVWPSQALMSAIGRYTSRPQREREQFAIDTFLAWENEVATCRKPELVRARDVSLVSGSTATPSEAIGPEEWVDWIDLLAEDAAATGTSWRDLAVAVKDRLLADPSLMDGEDTMIAALWGTSDLSGSPLTDDGVVSAGEVDLLRDYCGMLLASPDFVLRGVRLAPPLDPKRPDAVPCLPLEVCGQDELSKEYVTIAEELGYQRIDGR